MHVTLEDCGINWVPADGQRLFLDAAAGCLHTVEGRLVTSLQLPDGDRGTAEPGEAAARAAARGPLPSPQSSGSTTVRAGLVSAGPAVRAMLSSLDGSMTALRRGGRQLEIFDHATGNLFVEAPGAAEPGKTGRRDVDLLGFFWVQNEVGEPRLVMVTPLGLELYDLQPSRQGLRPPVTLSVPDTQWHLYDRACRLVILGFGPGGSRIQPVLFVPGSGATVRLPMLDLGPPWASSPVRGAESPEGAPVGPWCVWLLAPYRRAHLAFYDASAGALRLYRLFRDASSLAREYPLPGPARRIALSLIDNVVAVHLVESHVTLLYDIAGGRPLDAEDSSGSEDVSGDADALGVPHPSPPSPAAGTAASSLNALQLYLPDWALDAGQGVVYRLTLDLEEMTRASSDWDMRDMLSFLRRRSPSGVPSRDARAISVRLLRQAVADGRGLAAVRAGFDALTHETSSVYAFSVLEEHGACSGELPSEVIASQLFRPLLEAGRTSPDRLLGCLLECVASWECSGSERLDPGMGLVLWSILKQLKETHRVQRLLADHPLLISPELAKRILADGAAAGVTPARVAQLFVDAGHADEAVRLLLGRRQVESAARLARRLRVTAVPPGEILEAASASGDALLLASVYRLCAVHAQPAIPPLPIVALNARANYPEAWR
ncbi:hypothetical protein QBZ16_001651 [Prototheca wickerhamii]|uniref:Mic1 domain-containing protein n=1 Tax=Prototheca wickerhamii TaxID=3111 RepID=A0AAD9MK13_PROWI|nr:hypothetical protein QBZ16_001651 [Prototheca wickerhamii]